uniref:Uncharacterized protein n=1 Tax=Knipowitschia caucasica TaxID=637954 RepID=A0AAV2LI50_KNICA
MNEPPHILLIFRFSSSIHLRVTVTRRSPLQPTAIFYTALFIIVVIGKHRTSAYPSRPVIGAGGCPSRPSSVWRLLIGRWLLLFLFLRRWARSRCVPGLARSWLNSPPWVRFPLALEQHSGVGSTPLSSG